jgi:succinate dehydrogenase / fumarate reductase cytochrome b subunit
MNEVNQRRERPISPFMIGPYYKPQLTSVLSITHRATGVFLAFGALLVAWWLYAVAAGPVAYDRFAECARSPFGLLLLVGLIWSLVYHLLNGIRHLLWDVGWGFEIPRAYATGWMVVAGSLLGTALVWIYATHHGAP